MADDTQVLYRVVSNTCWSGSFHLTKDEAWRDAADKFGDALLSLVRSMPSVPDCLCLDAEREYNIYFRVVEYQVSAAEEPGYESWRKEK